MPVVYEQEYTDRVHEALEQLGYPAIITRLDVTDLLEEFVKEKAKKIGATCVKRYISVCIVRAGYKRVSTATYNTKFVRTCPATP